MNEREFQQRLDVARFVLERKYRWSRRILRNLKPVYRKGATLAVDKWYRLYYGEETLNWSDQEFVGCLWHEVNHLLRRHPERLEHMIAPGQLPPGMDPRIVNLAADLEINDDLKQQGVTLPDGLCYSDGFGHYEGQAAETHLAQFIEEYEQQEEQPQDGDGEPQDGEGGPGDKSSNAPSTAPPQPSGNEPQEGGGGQPQPGDMPNCGSGAGTGEQEEELPAPDDQEQARLNREERKLDEDIVQAAEENRQQGGSGLPPGLSESVVKASLHRLTPKVDWRQQLATELRTAFEQRADEAEEYSFRRRSRRQAAFPDAVLPGTYRPVPALGVVVDVSGSMNGPKVEQAMTEVHGILNRLAMPSFVVYPTNTKVLGSFTVETQQDIKRIFEDIGGGTNMMVGIKHAEKRGAEVIVCLTDLDSPWDSNGPNGVPVIIGSIDGRRAGPRWARTIEVNGKEV